MTMVEKIDSAINAHNEWKERLLAAIESGGGELKPEVIAKDDVCILGKWLYSDEVPITEKTSSDYEKVRTWHALFHKEAGYVIELVQQQKIDEAKQAMQQEGRRYFQVSNVLLMLLKQWHDRILAKPKG